MAVLTRATIRSGHADQRVVHEAAAAAGALEHGPELVLTRVGWGTAHSQGGGVSRPSWSR